MLIIFSVFWAEIFFLKGSTPALFIVLFVTAYIALLLALNSSHVSVQPDLVQMRSGPIPFPGGRRSLRPNDIDRISCVRTQGMAGRGGRIERWLLLATTSSSGLKQTPILDFASQEDAMQAAQILIRRLNQLRPATDAPARLSSANQV
jgi:hypothetical protein